MRQQEALKVFDYSTLIAILSAELGMMGLSMRSPRVLDYLDKLGQKRQGKPYTSFYELNDKDYEALIAAVRKARKN